MRTIQKIRLKVAKPPYRRSCVARSLLDIPLLSKEGWRGFAAPGWLLTKLVAQAVCRWLRSANSFKRRPARELQCGCIPLRRVPMR